MGLAAALDGCSGRLRVYDDASSQTVHAALEESLCGHDARAQNVQLRLAGELQQTRHGLVGERRSRDEHVVLFGQDVFACRVGRVGGRCALALKHCYLGDFAHFIDVWEMAHDSNFAARIVTFQAMEGVARIAAFGNALIDRATERFNVVGGRIIGIDCRDSEACFKPVPRFGQSRKRFQIDVDGALLESILAASAHRFGEAHAAIGHDVGPMRAKAVIVHGNARRNGVNQFIVKGPSGHGAPIFVSFFVWCVPLR